MSEHDDFHFVNEAAEFLNLHRTRVLMEHRIAEAQAAITSGEKRMAAICARYAAYTRKDAKAGTTIPMGRRSERLVIVDNELVRFDFHNGPHVVATERAQ